ncbi:MAG: hypothetical protein AAFN10_20370 [Bacteroidota bacterium]
MSDKSRIFVVDDDPLLAEIEREAKGGKNFESLASNIKKARLLHEDAVPLLEAALS